MIDSIICSHCCIVIILSRKRHLFFSCSNSTGYVSSRGKLSHQVLALDLSELFTSHIFISACKGRNTTVRTSADRLVVNIRLIIVVLRA